MIAYESWGLALVHFVWQGLLLAVLLFIALRSLSAYRAEFRHAAGLAALVIMAALPFGTLAFLEASRSADAARLDAEGQPTVPVGSAARDDARNRLPGSAGLTADVSEAPDGARQDAGLPGFVHFRESVREAFQPLLGWIVGLWAFGVLVLSIRMLGGWLRLRRLTRMDVGAVPAIARDMLRRLIARLAVTRAVRLVRSVHVTVPSVVGWMRPVILLPASALTGLTPSQLEAVLAHELAHIRRHDYLVNLVQTLIETLLFYHPAVWWVSRRVREERERCCDDLAVEVCGDRRLYATALLELETLRAPRERLAMAADGTSLVSRVRRLLEPDAEYRDRLSRWPAALSAAVVAIALAVACSSDSLTGPSARAAETTDSVARSSAMVFIGEAFADKIFRYEVTAGGGATLDREITENVRQPGGIAFSPSGEMFVSNRAGSVARFLDPEGAAVPNGLIATENTGAPFGQPHWLTFRVDELFLAQESGTVLRFTFGSAGNAVFSGTLVSGNSTRGIQTDPATGEILVSNLESSIHRFVLDGEGNGSQPDPITGGGLSESHGMAFTPWGELLVANYYGDNLSRFVRDGSGNWVPNGEIAGGDMRGPIDLDFSPWGELFVTNHNEVPGTVTRWTFSSQDPSARAEFRGSFTVPGNLGGIRFPKR